MYKFLYSFNVYTNKQKTDEDFFVIHIIEGTINEKKENSLEENVNSNLLTNDFNDLNNDVKKKIVNKAINQTNKDIIEILTQNKLYHFFTISSKFYKYRWVKVVSKKEQEYTNIEIFENSENSKNSENSENNTNDLLQSNELKEVQDKVNSVNYEVDEANKIFEHLNNGTKHYIILRMMRYSVKNYVISRLMYTIYLKNLIIQYRLYKLKEEYPNYRKYSPISEGFYNNDDLRKNIFKDDRERVRYFIIKNNIKKDIEYTKIDVYTEINISFPHNIVVTNESNIDDLIKDKKEYIFCKSLLKELKELKENKECKECIVINKIYNKYNNSLLEGLYMFVYIPTSSLDFYIKSIKETQGGKLITRKYKNKHIKKTNKRKHNKTHKSKSHNHHRRTHRRK